MSKQGDESQQSSGVSVSQDNHETPETDAVVAPTSSKPPPKKRNSFNAPKNVQNDILEWMLSGSADENGLYIYQVLSESMSVRSFTELVVEAGYEISRGSVGRFLKALRNGDYNDHILNRCRQLNLSPDKVFPGYTPTAKKGKGGLVVS